MPGGWDSTVSGWDSVLYGWDSPATPIVAPGVWKLGQLFIGSPTVIVPTAAAGWDSASAGWDSATKGWDS